MGDSNIGLGTSAGNAVPLAHDAHDCDGIHEFDNPMPFWWSAIFWGSIFYAALYALYYMIGVGPSHVQEFDDEQSVFFQEQAARLGDLQPTPATMSSLMADPRMMQAAAGMFGANCATCHAKDGGGGTGPNLCDDSWINVKVAPDIFAILTSGVVSKGMPAWDKRFVTSQRVLLAAYVAHLRGTLPSQPKAAQGGTIAPWALPTAAPLAQTVHAAGASTSGVAK
jgi:cytochrome c oxidase cbb3-type subunit 3